VVSLCWAALAAWYGVIAAAVAAAVMLPLFSVSLWRHIRMTPRAIRYIERYSEEARDGGGNGIHDQHAENKQFTIGM
jgi:hypothetical protein